MLTGRSNEPQSLIPALFPRHYMPMWVALVRVLDLDLGAEDSKRYGGSKRMTGLSAAHRVCLELSNQIMWMHLAYVPPGP